ncbi:tRNA 2-thiouridine(34) synthase MnmA [Methylolobus aquaticus]|nr:tRNA 2-thiouridine(34) synthase MnmA [Methylolobus aquaticus]
MERIVVGMSGGVDSAVAALLLLEQGFAVTGLFMKNWEEDDGTSLCTAKQDLEDASQVCERLGIPLRTVNFAAEYWDDVFEVFLREYQAGRTPNPDILCNKHIKFKAFLEHALDLGAERIATGHYARVGGYGGRRTLLKGRDAGKDQSYFLYAMGQAALQRSLFPVGELHKSEVRAMAQRAGFANHRKKDSTGICFIGERRFREFLSRFLASEPGEMRTPDGAVVGEHHGVMYYTLGQRQGLGIGGRKDGGGDAWYVLAKDTATNTLIVGQGHDHPLLYSDTLEADSLDWLGEPLRQPLRCVAKTRYRQPDQACRVQPLAEGRVRVSFDRPQRAVTPGQSVVLYAGDECLGGGIIANAYNQNTPAQAPAVAAA